MLTGREAVMPAGRYLPLLHYLAALSPEQHAVTLSFVALEALVDGPLPRTARSAAAYWTSGPVARVNWQRDGWTARLEHSGRAVTFTRLAPGARTEQSMQGQ
jgi:hypothetical protein